MKPYFLCLLIALAAVVSRSVFEVAHAQEAGPNRRVQAEPVAPVSKAPEKFGPATSQPARADGTGNLALGRERRPLYRLSKSDVLELSFLFTPEFNQTVTIQPDGFITLRDAGHIIAEGQNVPELEQAITAVYSRTLHDPRVSAAVKDFEHPYFVVSGEVARPGKYELRGNKTITEAVAIAGGFTQQSKHSQVVLFRRVSADLRETHVLNVKQMLKRKNLREDAFLETGDVIYVPRSVISKITRFMPATNMGMYTTSTNF